MVAKLAEKAGADKRKVDCCPHMMHDVKSTTAVGWGERTSMTIIKEVESHEIQPSFGLVKSKDFIGNMQVEQLTMHTLIGKEIIETAHTHRMRD